MQWNIYESAEYSFRLQYPNIYTITTGAPVPRAALPQPVTQIVLHRRDIAHHNTIDLEPPQFAVYIYANLDRLTINQWLERYDIVNSKAGWYSAPHTVGSISAIRVYSQNYIAPGWSVYIARDPYIFQLTPFGEFAQEILARFAFLESASGSET